MSVFVDGSGADVRAAYEDVRSEDTETTWAIFGYNGKQIQRFGSGTDYEEMLKMLKDDKLVYGYVRVESGDGMSRRTLYGFITWIGPSVAPLNKAAVSTDKAYVKQICPEFHKEILADQKDDLEPEKVLAILQAANDTAYGTGK